MLQLYKVIPLSCKSILYSVIASVVFSQSEEKERWNSRTHTLLSTSFLLDSVCKNVKDAFSIQASLPPYKHLLFSHSKNYVICVTLLIIIRAMFVIFLEIYRRISNSEQKLCLFLSPLPNSSLFSLKVTVVVRGKCMSRHFSEVNS